MHHFHVPHLLVIGQKDNLWNDCGADVVNADDALQRFKAGDDAQAHLRVLERETVCSYEQDFFFFFCFKDHFI